MPEEKLLWSIFGVSVPTSTSLELFSMFYNATPISLVGQTIQSIEDLLCRLAASEQFFIIDKWLFSDSSFFKVPRVTL